MGGLGGGLWLSPFSRRLFGRYGRLISVGRAHFRLDQPRWAIVRRRVLDRDGWRCQKCGLPGRLEVDHLTPLADGGGVYEPDNLQALCRPCHFAKTKRENEARRLTSPAVAKWQALLAEVGRIR